MDVSEFPHRSLPGAIDDDQIRNATSSITYIMENFDAPDIVHESDAYETLILNVTVIGCLLLAYYVKVYRVYSLPESAGTIMAGMVIGGIAILWTDDLQLFEFSPEVFFFVLLPPIIFEAGYSLKRKAFFENIGAITLYAIFGTIISTFVVGLLTFKVAEQGYIKNISKENPMEALLFGALISAVDPVATLSILGNSELQCDPLLYSLVFGESVLNDAVAIGLFKTFHKFYNPDGPNWSESEIPSALMEFTVVFLLSIVVGVGLGLVASFMYKHTSLSDYPKLETALLFCFCYLCYSTAEAMGLSGIIALFFNGVILSHYNSYNLSSTAHVASEQMFATIATITETIVFLYMGMGVFTGRFANWDIMFSVLAMSFCVLGRLLNIVPLSLLANCCRRGRQRIPCKMQGVLWFVGLRGAIAFALAENMPGPHKDTYATATLSICIFTTVICGGMTKQVLDLSGMKHYDNPENECSDTIENEDLMPLSSSPSIRMALRAKQKVYHGVKARWQAFDNTYLKAYFGGESLSEQDGGLNGMDRGEYELTTRQLNGDDDDLDYEDS